MAVLITLILLLSSTTAVSVDNTQEAAAADRAYMDQAVIDQALIDRGEYLYQAANCYACHTDVENDGKPLAGGRALESDFGTFYTPNITADSKTGIGSWSEQQFIDAVKQGIAPDGRSYYPSFPYLSYAGMKTEDVLAIRAWLLTRPAVEQANRDHELRWYLTPLTMRIWRLVNDYVADPVSGDGSRGSYLINTLGHCNECHTPRNALGMLDMSRRLRGNADLSAPDISASDDGVGDWSRQQLADLFQYGEMADGDYVADHMGEVVDYSTSKWTEDDLNAAIDYLLQQ